MARIEPIRRADLPDYEELFQLVEAYMGFVPSSMPTMARVPTIFDAFGQFASAVMNASEIDPALVQMVAHIASTAAECQYCQAHTATHAAHLGVPDEKIESLWEFDRSDLFTESERAALRLAYDAALVPNEVTDEHFERLAEHFTQEQVVQIVAVVSLFGFLNRWNDTMATTLEPEPLAYASRHLSARGWSPGKHASG